MKFIKPSRLPEANIQAEIYRQLRNRDIKCCLEYRIYIESMSCYMRADIVIIRDGDIIALIECKSRKCESEPKKDGRQYKKYSTLGVPFMYCMTFKQVPSIINKVVNLMVVEHEAINRTGNNLPDIVCNSERSTHLG